MPTVLLDNDVLAKATMYRLLDEIRQAFSLNADEFGVLGSVVYVLTKKRLQNASDGGEQAYNRLREFVGKTARLEPTNEETMFAAQLEDLAAQHKLQFDTGESQLVAISVARGISLLCTGDKRAISALEKLRTYESKIETMDEKVICFELIMKKLNGDIGFQRVRKNVCASRGTDIAIEICYQCHQADVDPNDIETCLSGYIARLQVQAPSICASSNRLIS